MNKPKKEIPAILLAGGRPGNLSVMARMMALGFNNIQKPKVAYIGTANGDNPVFFQMMKTMLAKAGAGKVISVRLAKDKADVNAARKVLVESDIVFLSGGEVEDGMVWLEKHNLTSFLKDLYKAGKPFMGVSAGVIMMGTHWVHWDIEGNDDTARLFDCLGIIPRLFDVHGESEDWTELKTALKLMGEGSHGYGLPRECVLSADSSGTLVNLEKEYLVFVNNGGRVSVKTN